MTIRTVLSKSLYWGAYAGLSGGFLAAVRRSWRRRCRAQWLDAEQVRQVQLDKLRDLLAHATRRVPHYRDMHRRGQLPDRPDTLEQFASVPALRKSDIIAQPDAFISETADRRQLIPHRSGGSTGQTVHYFVSPPAAIDTAAAEIWADSLAGYRLGDPIASLWGSHFDAASHSRSLRQSISDYLRNYQVHMTDRLDEPQMRRIWRRLSSFRPTVLLGYAGPLVEFARFIADRRPGPVRFPTRGLVTTAEPLAEQGRQLLREVFRRPVFDRYGTREVGLVAMECDRHEGLHVNAYDLLVELEPAADGPAGMYKVLVTKLNEYAMPLIRYELGDLVSGHLRLCSCGRGYPLIDHVTGRQVSVLRQKDGTPIAGEVFVALLDYQPVRRYRVVQQADYSVRIEIVPDDGYGPEAEATITKHVRAIIGDQLPLRIELRREIPLTPSGKLLPVISHVVGPDCGKTEDE